jgi:hypothetical protein
LSQAIPVETSCRPRAPSWPCPRTARCRGIFLIGAGSLVVGVILMVITARFLPRYFADGITAPMQGEGSLDS